MRIASAQSSQTISPAKLTKFVYLLNLALDFFKKPIRLVVIHSCDTHQVVLQVYNFDFNSLLSFNLGAQMLEYREGLSVQEFLQYPTIPVVRSYFYMWE